MSSGRVLTSAADGVGSLVLNSPEDRNALSEQLLTELSEGLDALLSDEDVRTLVLTGRGPAFCAGADLKTATDPGRSRALNERMVGVLEKIWDASKPLLCAVNGHVRGGGIGLVAAADVVVASRDATFAFTEVRLGVVPAVIAVPVLQRMHPRAALHLFLTGMTFDAAAAVDYGLINAAVDADDLETEVGRLADMVKRGAPDAVASAKRLARRVPELPMREAYREMLELSSATFESSEAREGVAAFLQRRKPSWVDDQSTAEQ